MGARSPVPSRGADKASYIRELFDTIAPGYDRMNLLMTLGQWRYWQWRLARRLEELPLEGARALDVACGTGEITAMLARRVGSSGHVTGLDFSPGMLAVARRRLEGSGLSDRVDLVQGDALDLPFPPGQFDLVTMGFALRNVADLDRALQEMARVTRPGGRVLILELSHSPWAWVRGPFRWYFERVVPAMGRWAARRWRGPGPDPYAWLPLSVRGFPGAEELAARMAAAGLEDVRFWRMSAGIVCLHEGRRPQWA
ncbi:class I SAM-dependent methyltransferase [Thermaerobacter marianensis]|nr:class I SAM-dependent methyltransferase [Thermaerobacter marianensis]